MPTIQEVRKQFPQYEDLSDDQLADALHRKFYADMPKEQFMTSLGLKVTPATIMGDLVRNSNETTEGNEAAVAEARRKRLVGEYEALPGWQKPIVATHDTLDLLMNGATFGFLNKAAAGARSLLLGKDYDKELAGFRRKTQDARDRAGLAAPVAEIAGGLGTGMAAGRAGLTLMRPGQSLPRMMAAGAVEGGGYGALSALGNDTDVGTTMATGAVIGGLAPAAIELLRRGFAPLYARLRPQAATDRAIATMVERSGRTPQQIVDDLNAAAQQGQGEYMVADALGNPGQRTLSTIARTPSNARAGVVEALEQRQAGQGERVAGMLDDAFGRPVTAAQTEAARTALRRTGANANYGAARASAGPVDVSAATQQLDAILQPGVTPMIGTGAADDGVFSTLRKMRDLLGTRGAQVSDFDRAFRAKIEMDAIIEKGGTAAALLRPARNALDDALSRASGPYANARDTYRAASQGIEAIDTGRTAAQRGRFEDTIPTFRRMSADQQAGFRAGYVDPLIEKTQRAAIGTNKARPLLTGKTAQEFPAFAQPGRAPRLGQQLGREMRMFETRNQALGNSSTAQNLGDIADTMGTTDVAFWSNLLTGNFVGAAGSAGRQVLASMQGLPPRVREQLAEFLLTRNSGQAMQRIARAVQTGQRLTARDLATIRMLTQTGIGTANQLQR